MKYNLSGDWKSFERIVAAIHSSEMAGSNISLNEKIRGREFDVAIRFKKGLHNYLTLIECKHYGNPIPVEKVEAFITKSSDAGANKSIMFSSSGFQSGAILVATRHNVDLYTVSEEFKIPEEIKTGGTTEGINICDIIFTIAGSEYSFPKENGRMEYIMKNSVLKNDFKTITVYNFIQGHINELFANSTYSEKEKEYIFQSGYKLTSPGIHEKGEVQKLKVIFKRMEFINLKPDTPEMDAHLFEKMHMYYNLKNEITGEDTSIMALDIALGFDTKIEVGKYYSNPHLGNNYYIESITDQIAKIYLLESYAKGNLFQVVYTQGIKYQSQFVAITNTEEILRLSKLYKRLKQKEK